MPPKKKGKKGKKGKGGKKTKEPADTITFNEAVMTNQLEVKEKEVSELNEGIGKLKFHNDKQKQKNQSLMKEQNQHMKTVVKQARDLELTENGKEKIPYENVEKALHEKLTSIRVEKQEIEQQKLQIDAFEREIVTLSKSLEQVKDYKEHGQHVNRTYIEVLNKEMEDMKISYAEMSALFAKSLATVKNAITKKYLDDIDNQKRLASERVVKNVSRCIETEIVDNRWLHKEVRINRLHVGDVEKKIEDLEQQNIAAMSQLFQQQVDDVNETKKFYLACKEAEAETSEDDDEPDEIKAIANTVTPKEKCSTEKIIAVDGEIDEQPADRMDHHLTEFDDAPDKEEYKLGPLEIKLLCVYGKKMEINQDDDSDILEGGFKRFSLNRKEILKIQ